MDNVTGTTTPKKDDSLFLWFSSSTKGKNLSTLIISNYRKDNQVHFICAIFFDVEASCNDSFLVTLWTTTRILQVHWPSSQVLFHNVLALTLLAKWNKKELVQSIYYFKSKFAQGSLGQIVFNQRMKFKSIIYIF